MDIQKRASRLRYLLDKEAASLTPSVPVPPPAISERDLFPKLKGINKPTALTSSSQPVIDLTKTKLATLPKMRTTGSDPKFKSTMNSANPYNKG